MTDLGVLVFGGPASGKTSLLTATWVAARERLQAKRFTIEPDLDDEYTLNVAREMLEDTFIEEKSPYYRAVQANAFPQRLRMYLRPATKPGAGRPEPLLTLTFVDTPGEFSQKRLSALVAEFQAGIRAGLLVVDVVELMAPPGQVHAAVARNHPSVVRRGIEEWVAASPSSQSLVLVLALAKCETWFRQRGDQSERIDLDARSNEVLDGLKFRYAELFEFLKQYQDRVAVVVCPTQTVGNLVFENYLPPYEPGGYPGEQFRKIRGEANSMQPATGYAPAYCEVPLQHILNFALIGEIEAAFAAADREVDTLVRDLPWWLKPLVGERSKKWLKSLNRALEGSLGPTAGLVETLSGFLRDIPSGPGFATLQGEPLLARSYTLWLDVWKALTS
ncbi:MAG: hypothetical protein AB7O92_08140 [Acidimicrobiia bacterium]